MATDQKFLKFVGTSALDAIKNRIISGKIKPKTKKAKGKTLFSSGALLNSINKETFIDKIVIGTDIPYARIHQEGGTIRPKKAKYLAIPLTPAAKAKNPRYFENTFIKKGIIFQNNGNKKPIALYSLKKSVKIPARPFLFLNNQDINNIISQIENYYLAKFKGGK